MDNYSQPTCSKKEKGKQKKEPGGVTGKSVVVLKGSDVTTRNEIVFMPNTIEMAQLKKPEKRQFKTGVQFSDSMTEMDIERMLVEIFPFLEHQRFYCAAAVDNRTRLDFHGEPRIWNGQSIKRKIRGNSALYIFTKKEKSVDSQDSTLLVQSTPKRTHDQITTQENEKSEQPSKRKPGCKGAMTVRVGDAVCPMAISTITSGQQKVHIPDMSADAWKSGMPSVTNMHMVSQEKVSSMLTPQMDKLKISYASSTTAEQSDPHFQQTPAGLQHHSKQSPDEKNYSGVAQAADKRSMNNATVRHQELRKAPVSDHEGESEGQVASNYNSSTSDSGYDGETAMSFNDTTMVPAAAVCPGAIPRTILSTTSDQEISEAVFHSADGSTGSSQSGLPLATLTEPQSIVSSMLAPQMTNLKIKSTPVQKMKPKAKVKSPPQAATGLQRVDGIIPSKQSSDEKALSQPAEERVFVDNATERHGLQGSSVSGRESQPSDFTDSGNETNDNPGGGLPEIDWNNLPRLLYEVIETDPVKTPREGGGFCHFTFKENTLPLWFMSGFAVFEGLGTVALERCKSDLLFGKPIPPSPCSGWVNILLFTETWIPLGKTRMYYYDKREAAVLLVLDDPELQTQFFDEVTRRLAMGRKRSRAGERENAGNSESTQAVQELQLLVLAAAETGNQQFLEMLFTSSAARIVFDSYKDHSPLPEVIARNYGHERTARYLEDITARFSKEAAIHPEESHLESSEVVASANEAAQKQLAVAQDESNQQLKHLCESDDNSSEYFADAETSSCGSFDLDDVYDADSDSQESTEKEPCTTSGVSEHGPSKTPGTGDEGCSNKITFEQENRPDSTSDNDESCGQAHTLGEMNVEAFKVFYRNINSGGTNVHDTSEKVTTKPKGSNKVEKWEDNFPMQQSVSLDKKDKTESSILINSPGIAYIFDEADVQDASETSAAKPKEDVFDSERNPSPKDIFVNNHSKPHTKDLYVECECMKNQHCEDLCIESECIHRTCPCKSRMTTVLGSSTFNKKLPLGDPPMEDASMEELMMERLKFLWPRDFETGKMSSIEPHTADGMSNQGPNKRPFTCKEVPSNSLPVEKLEPADNKKDEEVSRLLQGEVIITSRIHEDFLHIKPSRERRMRVQELVRTSLETSRCECERKPQLPPLPPMVPYFTGCKKECEEIVSHITSQSTRIVLISGSPGCGKSAIAIRVAHDFQSQELPVCFLSLQERASKYELTSKLLSFVRQSSSKKYTNANKDLSIDEQVLKRFSKVSEKCVVILDNADDELRLSNTKEEILLLLGSIRVQNNNVKLIVTTREHSELADLHSQVHHAVMLQLPRVTLTMKSEELTGKMENSLHPKESLLDIAEDVNTTVEFVSERNPSPKDIFVNSHSEPDSKDFRICPCKSGMPPVVGSSTFNKELLLGDLPMEDASMEDLQSERLRLCFTSDFEAGKLPSIEPCTADAMSNQGPNKRPFTCKEVPSNSAPVERVERADNKEHEEVSRLLQAPPVLQPSRRGEVLIASGIRKNLLHLKPSRERWMREEEHLRTLSETLRREKEHLRTLSETLRREEEHLRTLSETLRREKEHLRSLSETLRRGNEFEMEISEMLEREKEDLRTLSETLRRDEEIWRTRFNRFRLERIRHGEEFRMEMWERLARGKDGRADKILEHQYPAQSYPKLARETSIYDDEGSPKASHRVTTIIERKSTQKKNCEKLTRHIPYNSAQNLINSCMLVFGKAFVAIDEAHEPLLVQERPGYYRSLEGFRSKGKLTLKRFTNHLSTNDVLDHLSKASIDDVDDVEDQRGSGLSNAKEQALELCQETFMQSKKVKFIGDCTNFAFEDYEVKLIQPEMLQEDQFLLFQSKKGKFIGECTNFYCEDHEVIRSQPEITQEVFIAQHGQNVDDAVIIGLLRDLLPNNVNENGNDNDDNSSHTFTRATRNLLCQPAFKRSIITSKPKDSISDPGFAVCYLPLKAMPLKTMDSYLSGVGQATSALCVLIHDGDDNVTGYVLPNVKEEVLELLGKILMPNRNVTLVMASGESSSQHSVIFVPNVTKRQELDH